jgi:hypothetical protein
MNETPDFINAQKRLDKVAQHMKLDNNVIEPMRHLSVLYLWLCRRVWTMVQCEPLVIAFTMTWPRTR